MYNEQFDILSKNQEISMVDLSPPSVWKKKSPLKSFTWTKGSLRFDYLRHDQVTANEFEHFQVN